MDAAARAAALRAALGIDGTPTPAGAVNRPAATALAEAPTGAAAESRTATSAATAASATAATPATTTLAGPAPGTTPDTPAADTPAPRPAPEAPTTDTPAPHASTPHAGTTRVNAPHAPTPTPVGDEPRRGFDLRRIVRGEVGVVAVPVVAEAHVAARPAVRRKNVIGVDTTGSIPVHLLFRDEPEPDPRTRVAREDDDGGPATVAMAAPTPPAPKADTTKAKKTPKGGKTQGGKPPKTASPTTASPTTASPNTASPKAAIPAPARPQASRPAPTADPKLVERAGPVLPGWMGVVGGMLALAGCAAILWWTGAVPEQLVQMLRLPPRPYQGIHLGQWALLAAGVLATLFSLGGLGRGRVGYAFVLTLFGDYRGTVRRTGLVWVSPLLLRRRVDVRLRHWRSEPLASVDAKGTALNVVVLVVWRIRDTVRAAFGVEGHEEYLREQVEAAMARVLSQLPADAFHEDAPTLRDAEAVGEALTRMLSAECAPVGIDVFSAQPTRIEYAPEIAAAMQRRRIAAIDAKHRDSVLTSVVDAVDDVVHRLTTRGLVELDDYERKALVKDLTVAFYTGRTGPVEGA
ncbi:SPFH domain-containing protein [Streptomyces sp. NPDC090127]|uniref:SPFH domain-containing protein n=1 Tax=Streptomyces sp. NPDC090127 TaxID=3365953 RepID=UPI0037FD0AE9